MHIHELILDTHSLHRTKLFYHKTLELDILRESEESITFRAGRTELTFRQSDNKAFYHFAFNVSNNRFSDSFEWINQKLDILPVSNEMMIAGYDNWNAQSFYFHDNNGNILEFIVRFDLPYQSSSSSPSDWIEELSEIGLVTNDVAAAAEQLSSDHSIPYFRKGPRLHDFIAMGDDYGLLLICQEKRGWVPTHKPAQHFPCTIVTGLEDKVVIEWK